MRQKHQTNRPLRFLENTDCSLWQSNWGEVPPWEEFKSQAQRERQRWVPPSKQCALTSSSLTFQTPSLSASGSDSPSLSSSCSLFSRCSQRPERPIRSEYNCSLQIPLISPQFAPVGTLSASRRARTIQLPHDSSEPGQISCLWVSS